MNYRTPYLIAALTSALLLAGILLAGSAASRQAREVELSDARIAPSKLAYLKPGQDRTYAHGVEGWNCPHRTWFSDVSAYHWDGSALGPQRFDARALKYVWRNTVQRARRSHWRSVKGQVTFDGITFHNRTGQPVIVAGWCE